MCPEPDVLSTRIYSNAGDCDKSWCSFTLNTFGWIFFSLDNSIRGKIIIDQTKQRCSICLLVCVYSKIVFRCMVPIHTVISTVDRNELEKCMIWRQMLKKDSCWTFIWITSMRYKFMAFCKWEMCFYFLFQKLAISGRKIMALLNEWPNHWRWFRVCLVYLPRFGEIICCKTDTCHKWNVLGFFKNIQWIRVNSKVWLTRIRTHIWMH